MKKTFLLLLILVPSLAQANTTYSGKIRQVYLNPINGNIQLDYGYGTNTICSVNQETIRVKPEACKALYSGLLAAHAQEKDVEIRYNGNFNCSASELGHFTAPQKEAYLIYYN